MYAVIETGGKQYRVEEGQQLEVERLKADGELQLAPVLVVDGDRVLATPEQLKAVTIKARVVGDAKGPKIRGFTYKSKTNQRRHWGHRQHYSVIEVTGISAGGARKASPTSTEAAPAPEKPEPAKAAPAKKAPAAKKAPTKRAPAKKATARTPTEEGA